MDLMDGGMDVKDGGWKEVIVCRAGLEGRWMETQCVPCDSTQTD